MHHFFVDPAQVMGDFIRITGPDVNHMKNALRMKQGEEVLVSDGTGTDYHCCLSSLNSDCVEARIVSADRDFLAYIFLHFLFIKILIKKTYQQK